MVMSAAHGDPVACCVTPSKVLPAVELHQVALEDLFLQRQRPAGTGTPTATRSAGEKAKASRRAARGDDRRTLQRGAATSHRVGRSQLVGGIDEESTAAHRQESGSFLNPGAVEAGEDEACS